jgi:hypothetical protein
MIFSMSVHGTDVENAFLDTEKLFHSRMLRHIDDKLFITTTGKNIANKLELDALSRQDMFHTIFSGFFSNICIAFGFKDNNKSGLLFEQPP